MIAEILSFAVKGIQLKDEECLATKLRVHCEKHGPEPGKQRTRE